VADLDPRLRPLSKQDFDLAGIDIVVNTHLHFDRWDGRVGPQRPRAVRPVPRSARHTDHRPGHG
jgi:L-ascorbate metabolism protein UlaG (beta-lactamase superfamily)